MVGVGDFDANGLSDVLLHNQTSGEVGAWLLQTGGAANGWKTMGVAPANTWAVVGVGDFDANGLSDVLLHNQSSGEVGTWLLQNRRRPERLEDDGRGPGYDMASGGRGRLRCQRILRRVAAQPVERRGRRLAASARRRSQRLEDDGHRARPPRGRSCRDALAGLQAASLIVDSAADVATLTQGDLQPIIAEAIARWAASGLDAATLARLAQVQFAIRDLPGAYLGEDRWGPRLDRRQRGRTRLVRRLYAGRGRPSSRGRPMPGSCRP